MSDPAGTSADRRYRSLERYGPVIYLTAAFAMVAALLPSALRPPDDRPPPSAAFSPDEPPDDSEVLITELQRGSTATAGAGAPTGGLLGSEGPAARAVQSSPRKSRCWGSPPRQIETVYSPPCVAAFTGNNGGATSRGVTRDEIRIAFMMSLTGNASVDGPIVTNPPRSSENANTRTYRVLEQYFNERYEFYGRRVRFYYVQNQRDDSGDPTRERAAVVRADEVYKVFAAMNETSVAQLEELARRGIVSFTMAQVNREFLAARRPYLFSATPDSTSMVELAAEYLCKKLAGRPPVFTDDPAFDYTKPRIFGVVSYQSGNAYRENVPLLRRLMREQCSERLAEAVEFADYTGPDASTAIARMRAANVTTIVNLADFPSTVVFTHEADAAGYFPEWYIPSFGGNDVIPETGEGSSKRQFSHAFGFTLYEIPTVPMDNDCHRAYRSVDPDNTADEGMCYYMWVHMVQLLGAMQMAGPNLTAESLQRGLYALGSHPPDPAWRMAGGYSPSDWTYPDYAAEIWYDTTATHPRHGRLGAWRFTDGGKRFKQGEVPRDGGAKLFKDGIVTQPHNP